MYNAHPKRIELQKLLSRPNANYHPGLFL